MNKNLEVASCFKKDITTLILKTQALYNKNIITYIKKIYQKIKILY